jgi:hypothetical protein
MLNDTWRATVDWTYAGYREWMYSLLWQGEGLAKRRRMQFATLD